MTTPNTTDLQALIADLRKLSKGSSYTSAPTVKSTLLEAADALEALKDAKCPFCSVNFQQGQSGLSASAAPLLPMTETEILAILESDYQLCNKVWLRAEMGTFDPKPYVTDAGMRLVRAIEAHHKIG